ncbi:hypothetical protein PUN28_006581 [Cardiocondyla obscurior]|uniref:Uncharacterized protein n=1 Tax=Cardiocondyla obscurior TaxID=286306 RepID=A0AAW2G9X2_9HYME
MAAKATRGRHTGAVVISTLANDGIVAVVGLLNVEAIFRGQTKVRKSERAGAGRGTEGERHPGADPSDRPARTSTPKHGAASPTSSPPGRPTTTKTTTVMSTTATANARILLLAPRRHRTDAPSLIPGPPFSLHLSRRTQSHPH